MSASVTRRLGLSLLFAGLAGLTACGHLRGDDEGFWGTVTPYKVDIIQGNIVSREQVQVLRPGMSRLQVRDILGSPLVASLFHADRWDYVFTIRRQGVAPITHTLRVYFEGDELKRFEGDDMPSETEFVARLESARKPVQPRELKASDEVLKQASKAQTAGQGAPESPLPVAYPPLEPAPAR